MSGYRGLPDTGGTLRDVARVVNLMLIGRLSVRTTVTFRASETTTTLQDPRINSRSHISIEPLTANALAAKATAYISAQSTGTVTWTHASDADADQNFSVLIIG